MPSAVVFFSGCLDPSLHLRILVEELDREGALGRGDCGKEEVEFLAGAFRMPKGSLNCDTFDSSRTEPGTSSVSGSFSIPIFHLAGFLLRYSSFSLVKHRSEVVGLFVLPLLPGDLLFSKYFQSNLRLARPSARSFDG